MYRVEFPAAEPAAAMAAEPACHTIEPAPIFAISRDGAFYWDGRAAHRMPRSTDETVGAERASCPPSSPVPARHRGDRVQPDQPAAGDPGRHRKEHGARRITPPRGGAIRSAG